MARNVGSVAARAEIARRLGRQARACRALGSPLYSYLLERSAVDTQDGGQAYSVLEGHESDPPGSALALRLMGAVHRLVLELGASAGLNLRWDRYRYEANGMGWGDPTSPVRIADPFVGRPLPPFETSASVVERGGCDPGPLDPTSEEGRLTLLSYVWADQRQRLQLLRDALEAAPGLPVRVESAAAAEWLAARLANAREGTATVVYYSIVMQYLDAAERERLDEIFAEAGARASRTAPLIRLALEPGGEEAELRLTTWPGGEERLLAMSGYHGRPVRWRQPVRSTQDAGSEDTT